MTRRKMERREIMNKLFTKIATAFVGIAMAIGVGVAVGSHGDFKAAEAADSTYTLGTIPTTGWTSKGGSQTMNKISWTYDSCTFIGNSSSRIQIGSKNSPQTSAWHIYTAISNFGSGKVIKSVTLTAFTTQTTATYDISVGGSSVKSGSLTTSSAGYTASNLSVSSGNIDFTLKGSSNSKAMYISGISVTYGDAPSSKTLSSIAVTTAPSTTSYYVNQSFDPTGMVVTATYSDASTANVTSGCTYSPDPFATTGSQNVTISYTEGGVTKTTTQSVTVSADSLSSISIADYNTMLILNDPFVFGGTVTATYVSGATADVTSSTTFSGYNMASEGNQTVTVSYTEGGVTRTQTYTLNVVDLVIVTFDATSDTGSGSITKSNLTLSCSNGVLNNNSEYRLYKNSNTVISSTKSKNIKRIEFKGVSGNPASGFDTQTGWTTDGYDGTWIGSATSVTFTAGGAQVRATKIIVYVEKSSIDATINGNDSVNAGTQWSPTSITVNGTGTTVTGATFAFAASDGAVISASNTSTGAFTASHAGTVTVSATLSGYSITSKVVTVNSVDPYINLTLNSSSSAYTGQTVSISATYGNGVTGLAWSVTSGAIIGTATTSNSGYSAKIGGETGTLTIKAQDTGNTSAYATVNVTVIKTAFTTSPSDASVQENKTTTLSAALNSGGSISWSSSDNTVASVSDGVVTGVSEGTTTITAQSADDTRITASCTVTVTEAPAEVAITYTEIANFSNSYAERDWTYGTGTAAISGKIKAYKTTGGSAGVNNIQMNNNNSCYMYNTDAIPGYITGITFTKVTGTENLTAWVGDEVLSSNPAEGGTANNTYTWSFNASDKHSYFRVATSGSTGAIVASKITITYEKVALVDPTSITINDKTTISMDTYGYGKRNLTATVGPVNANDKTVTWGTSDPSVVTVSNGVLTPVGVGDATVYATAVNYVSDQETPDLKDSVSVHVTQALYKKATFTPTSTSTVTQSDDYLSDGSVSISAFDAGQWDNNKSAIQLASGKDVTFTISGYAGMKITGIDMVVSSNGNAGAGSLSVTAGSTNVLSIPTATFADASWNGAYDSNPVQLYRDITDYVVSGSQTIVFTFSCSVNSLYVHSVSVRYIDYSLEQWCERFLTTITCDGSDSITDDSKWGTLGSDFLELDEDLRGIAAGATANKDSDNVIEQAMARYDLILRKYGIGSTAGKHTDFIGRFGEGTINGNLAPHIGIMISKNTINTSIIVIVTVGIAAIAIGGYFLLRKKKED